MRLHVLGLPHTQTTDEYLTCAYTQKAVKFCSMMMSLGHEVFLYAGEHNTAPCTEHIVCISDSEQRALFGIYDPLDAPNVCQVWDPTLPEWSIFNTNIIDAIRGRLGTSSDDILCLVMGSSQSPIGHAYPNLPAVEIGIGYEGVDFSHHLVFESYAWMHMVYGFNQIRHGRNYDAVIPNAFDPMDFPYSEEKDDYFLYVGRIIRNKGIEIAVESCERLGKRLIIAGPGGSPTRYGLDGLDVSLEGACIDYRGPVGVEERGKLMSRARAVFVPTIYVEPFGGVNVEAMLCGTPVITSDYGGFTESVVDGVTGYRARTIGEYVWAAEHTDLLDPGVIRDWAVANYGVDRVRHLYQAHFDQVLDLARAGFYTDSHTGVSVDRRYERMLP